MAMARNWQGREASIVTLSHLLPIRSLDEDSRGFEMSLRSHLILHLDNQWGIKYQNNRPNKGLQGEMDYGVPGKSDHCHRISLLTQDFNPTVKGPGRWDTILAFTSNQTTAIPHGFESTVCPSLAAGK